MPMDIREWLQHTADREPPPDQTEDDRANPDFLRPQRREELSSRRNYHKRKRVSSDPPDSDRLLPAEVASTSSSSADTCESSPSGRDGSSSPSKTYERRPRRKTRTDRYEPRSKKDKKPRHAHNVKDKKSKSSRRKSRKSADGARTSGLVQSFQLKSGSKNSRLTVSFMETCKCCDGTAIVQLTCSDSSSRISQQGFSNMVARPLACLMALVV